MPKRWCGVTASKDGATCVDAEVDDSGSITVVADHTWKLQRGARPKAYAVLSETIVTYLQEHEIDKVLVKASATTGQGMGKAHLLAAEVRGVVLSAGASVTTVSEVTKMALSKNVGIRKADEYIKDDGFWLEKVEGSLRKGSREAALMILVEAENEYA